VAAGVLGDLRQAFAQESAQDPEQLNAATLTDAVVGGAAEIVSLAAALREMELEGRAGSTEYAEARTKFDAADGYALEDRVGAALRGLGFPTARHAEAPARLSGGEQTRVALARLVAQSDIAVRTLQQRQAQQSLIAQRFAAGLDTQTEQTQSDGNLSDAQSQIEALQEQITLVRHQLAVLSGQAPQTLTALSPQFNAIELDAVPAVLGADLLGRRPDIVASRWRVEAASQDVRVARTQFYPNLNLSAFIGFNALGVSRLFNADSLQLGVSPALRLPLFDGGRLQAQLTGRQAELDMAVSQYNFTVLEAVKESADAISSDQSLRRQAELQTAALESAQKNHALAHQRFDAGLGNQLNVLSAETAVLLQSRARVELRARQLDNRINLMKALGGGWREASAASAHPLASMHKAQH
jgi:outer membrane protein TolC